MVPEQVIIRDAFEEDEKQEGAEKVDVNNSPLGWEPSAKAADAASPAAMTFEEVMANNLPSSH
jgi:hypothetical protein